MLKLTPRFQKEERKMSSLAATQGIAFSDEKIAEIRHEIASSAIPGFTGTLSVIIGLTPDAVNCVTISVLRREVHNLDKPTVTQQDLPDPKRRKPVDSVIDAIRQKLIVRTGITALEVEYVDGVPKGKFKSAG
jgi:hypothetical protein